MGYRPKFTLTARLSALIADISETRQKLSSLKSPLASDRDTHDRTRSHQIYSSLRGEGVPVTLERVLAMANGEDFPVVTAIRERQVLDQFAKWRCSESKRGKGNWTHKDVLQLHKI